ncbi:ABC transporter ATP-binding protein [Tranquillimonas rosea]|uniref:ABC transporter ATP-binding protein n=1 Tax=Tranquillimonas rosea TaxID=641238 RepID=UPI003BA9D5EE
MTAPSDPEAALRSAHREAGQGPIRRITRMTLDHPLLFTISVVSTLIAAGLQLTIPLLLGRAVDQTQGLLERPDETAQGALLLTALTLLVVSMLRGVFTMAQNYTAENLGHRVGYALRLAVYDKTQRLSFSFHDKSHSGDLVTLGILDLEGVRMYFSTAFIRTILLTVLIGVGAAVMVSIDPVLALVALCFAPFVAWRSSATQLRMRATWLELQDRLAVLTRVMEENLGGIRVVRAFAGFRHEMFKFDRASAKAMQLAFHRVALRVRNSSAMTLSFFAAMGLVLWVGGGKVIAGSLTVGELTTFLTFMTILQMPVRQLGLMVNAFARAGTCGRRVFDLLDREVEIEDAPDAKPLEIGAGTLRFEDVHFAYPDAPESPILNGVSFEATRGETVGIVGPPGSGKSTLSHLIPRFYDVTDGTISIDGQDIRDVRLDDLRRAAAVVQQDSFLFTTTLENNIAYADPWATDTRIAGAAGSAQLHDYIIGLPEQYGTVVGERGVSLSGGQRQRLSIARTVMQRPNVLVFDDSTAAIDAATEARIRAAMEEEADSRVTLIVAHRLASLMHADRILFLDKGRVVEEGTHDELLAKGGRYAALHALQTRPEDDVVAEMEDAR